MFDPCLVMQYLKSPFKFCNYLTEEERAGCFACLFDVMWLLVFCVSSLLCCGLICSMLLLHFLAIFTTGSS